MTHLILPNGIEEWVEEYVDYNGDISFRYHRTDGPAQITPDGAMRWYRHGEKHRTDGPAIINSTLGAEYGGKATEWWIDGDCLYESILVEYFKDVNSPTDDELVIFKLSYTN